MQNRRNAAKKDYPPTVATAFATKNIETKSGPMTAINVVIEEDQLAGLSVGTDGKLRLSGFLRPSEKDDTGNKFYAYLTINTYVSPEEGQKAGIRKSRPAAVKNTAVAKAAEAEGDEESPF